MASSLFSQQTPAPAAQPPQNNAFQQIAQLKNMLRGQNPAVVMQNFARMNPQFAQFMQQYGHMSPQQICQQFGLDFGQVQQMIR